MSEIDQPFRPRKDFFVAWFVIAVGAVAYSRPWTFDLPWFSKVAFVLIVPLALTFFIYGPIMLMRQIASSGTRGWFVLRVFLSITVGIASILGVAYLIGGESAISGHPWGVILGILAVVLLNLAVGREDAGIGRGKTG